MQVYLKWERIYLKKAKITTINIRANMITKKMSVTPREKRGRLNSMSILVESGEASSCIANQEKQ